MAKNWSKGTQPISSQQRTEGSEPIPPTTSAPAASPGETVGKEEASRRLLLRVIQPGLAGLMDGSVSTLAPIFATAFATHRPFTAFLVGMAAATGAGISMAVELVAIAAIRYRFLGTRWWLSILQVVGGGALVFAAAWIFGNA